MARLLRAPARTTPDEWGASNRRYPETAGYPGPRDPSLTPYVIPFVRAVAGGTHRRVVLAVAAQCGKTEALLDVIGHRLDERPTPILYVGPNRQFLVEQLEPRVMELLDQAPALAKKVARGQANKKTRKLIAGVPLRLAHGGSSTALKSDPAGLALTDEADELLQNVKGQGDPIGLVDARGDTHPEFVHVIVSTPSKGAKEVMRDPVNGLEFWSPQEPDDVDSKIWSLWQEGTRYHWTWRCPHCATRFVPRFSCLEIPDVRKTTPTRAKAEAHLVCPNNGCVITDADKAEMNATGVYIAPGQAVDEQGDPVGPPPEAETISFWVSGLASPFRSFGDRASAYVQALRTGDHQSIQTVINAGFGELWAPVGGDAPEWEMVRKREHDYAEGQVPEWVMFLTSFVDVQKNRLIYVVRGWGERQQSALITSGEIWGDTSQDEVWNDLATDVLQGVWGGLAIARMFVDAGFRPGKKDLVPEHMVYEFARRFPRQVFATKGWDKRPTPVSVSRIDVAPRGSKAKVGLDLVRIDTDFMKSWVHERLRWPDDQPGGWFIHRGASEDYCKQVVAEARIKKPGGGTQWVTISRDNHFLDCFDEQTELLTDAGWMSVAQAVNYGGLFASVNLATDQIEYQQAFQSVARDHVGEMVEIKGRGVDMLITPNHRMVTTRLNPVDKSPRITLAGDLTVWHALKKTASWQGSDPGPFTFAAVNIPLNKRGPLVQPERVVEAGDWFEFLGWFVSEGHVRAQGQSLSVVITQNPGEKQDRICALLDRMGFAYKVTGGRQITVNSRRLFEAVADCAVPGDGRACYRKCVPPAVKAGTPELIERFVEAAILGDGWVQDKMRTYATTSRRLADDMQEIFLKIGRSANVRVRKVQPCRIRGGNSKTVDQFHVSETRTASAMLRRANNSPLFKRVTFSGKVYCVSVPNGTLIARRNGLPVIVGNCEAGAFAAAFMLGVQRIPDGSRERVSRPPAGAAAARATPMADGGEDSPAPAARPATKREGFLPRNSIWR